MKTRRILSLVLSLILAIPLSLSLAVPASAADLTYDVTGGRIYFDANTGAITDCRRNRHRGGHPRADLRRDGHRHRKQRL